MCTFCGNKFKHVFKKKQYLERGKTCKRCHGGNNFSVKCKKVNLVERNLHNESSDEELWLNVVNSLNCDSNSFTTVMNVNNCDVRFKLDNGAQSNTVQKKYVRKKQVLPSSSTFHVFNSAP